MPHSVDEVMDPFLHDSRSFRRPWSFFSAAWFISFILLSFSLRGLGNLPSVDHAVVQGFGDVAPF